MTTTGRFVLDSSIALAWCFSDETNLYADSICALFPSFEAIVPAIWPLEIANILVAGERRGRNTQADTIQWTRFLSSLPIVIDEKSNAYALSDTVDLARSLNLSAHDASYLELAIRLSLPFATLDGKLKSAAIHVGVSIFQVPTH